ncbi:uncharacterized protein LOC143433484 [Xylocopa sonorina]|uniref:uncharacterized protein LOC143433484 n=1 Tax=Xylocopa sonorina TaxID=1818115 RepID=UPI00403B190F
MFFHQLFLYVPSTNKTVNCESAVSSRSRRRLSVNGVDAGDPIGGVQIPGTKETGIRRASLTMCDVTFRTGYLTLLFPHRNAVLRFYWPQNEMDDYFFIKHTNI